MLEVRNRILEMAKTQLTKLAGLILSSFEWLNLFKFKIFYVFKIYLKWFYYQYKHQELFYLGF